jgi:hypothetical protein
LSGRLNYDFPAGFSLNLEFFARFACIPIPHGRGTGGEDGVLRVSVDIGKKQIKAPLKDAAAVNATRWMLWEALQDTGLPVEASSGGRTKWNRTRLGIAKTHALDAACVGEADALKRLGEDAHPHDQGDGARPILPHQRQRERLSRRLRHVPQARLRLPSRRHGAGRSAEGARKGIHVGRVGLRARGSFKVGIVNDISWKHCRLLQRADGYGYSAAVGA